MPTNNQILLSEIVTRNFADNPQYSTEDSYFEFFSAQQVLKNEEIDFMLCDIEMPNGTGLDLAEWMRQHYPEIECVFITGHEDFDYARRALRLGSVDYVLKPVNYEEMDTILMKLVKSLSRKAVVESVSESIVHDLEERDSENASVIPKVKQYIIEHLSENIYICCRNNKNSHENIYSKYILVVALFTPQTVVRNAVLCIY